MPHFYRYSVLPVILLLSVLAASCNWQPGLSPGGSLQLTSFTDLGNKVAVSVRLDRLMDGSFLLSATYTAPKGYHLYSKNIPRNGVYGHGRPTLLELPPGSKMRAVGPLTASEADEIFGHEPEGPPVYPEGPVTLTLPVKLPTGQNGWVDDEISLTYMTCSLTICDSPTVGKLVPVKVPSMAAIGNP